MSNMPPFLPIQVDILEAYNHILIIPQENRCRHNQYLNNYPSKRAWTNMEIYDFNARLEKVIEEHNDQIKLPKTVVNHINKFIRT
eukprot:4170077-Ditylum_brightwellii.AAC.1